MPALPPASGGVVAVPESLVFQASCVAIAGRALAIEGPPGSGKSSLALALIDRGAQLIGDDAVTLSLGSSPGTSEAAQIIASPPPNIAGLMELRGVGLVELPLAPPSPLALVLTLGAATERLPENVGQAQILGLSIPHLPFEPGSIAPAVRAEWALRVHGIGAV